jgi:hypothetical protein
LKPSREMKVPRFKGTTVTSLPVPICREPAWAPSATLSGCPPDVVTLDQHFGDGRSFVTIQQRRIATAYVGGGTRSQPARLAGNGYSTGIGQGIFKLPVEGGTPTEVARGKSIRSKSLPMENNLLFSGFEGDGSASAKMKFVSNKLQATLSPRKLTLPSVPTSLRPF